MFSYSDYKEIINIIKESGRGCNFRQAQARDKFIIMRHDVEFSVDRAFALSKLELSMDFTSTYFFQWTNNSYNILSKKNMDMIKYMHERGHVIGLHFALNGLTDMELVRKKILQEIHVLSEMIGVEITEFSIHRPSADVLRENIKFPGIINAYQDELFRKCHGIHASACKIYFRCEAQVELRHAGCCNAAGKRQSSDSDPSLFVDEEGI